jgi:hypothetical protein
VIIFNSNGVIFYRKGESIMEKKYLTIEEAKELGIDVENINNTNKLEDIVDEDGKEVLPESEG